MKYNRDSKIEFILDEFPDHKDRRIYYRVLPSELPWFKRIFHNNRCYSLYHAYEHLSGTKFYFTAAEFQDILKKIKTWGDVCDYLTEQNKIIEERHDRCVREGIIWPDED